MNNARRFGSLAVLSLLLAAPLSASAASLVSPRGAAPCGVTEAHLSYPATAETFRHHVSERIEETRARMEQYIQDRHLAEDKARALRAHFQSAVREVNAKVDAVCADGTVTADEAREVHALAVSLRHEHVE